MGLLVFTQDCGEKGQLSPITINKINSLYYFQRSGLIFSSGIYLKGSRKCCRIGIILPDTWLCPKYDKRIKIDVFEESQWQSHNIREAALAPLPSESTGHGSWSSCGPPGTTKEAVFGSELTIIHAWTGNSNVRRWFQKYQMKLSLLPYYIRWNF